MPPFGSTRWISAFVTASSEPDDVSSSGACFAAANGPPARASAKSSARASTTADAEPALGSAA